MPSQIKDTTEDETRASRGSRIGALHEYIQLPFQSCLTGTVRKRGNSTAGSFVPCDETLLLRTPPPSRSPTVSGSISEHSTDSHPLVDDSEKSVPLTVTQEQDSSFISEASVDSQEILEDDDLDFEPEKNGSFFLFRMSYLFVTLVVMLADGMQGE